MPTEHHDLNQPDEGTLQWHVPLNDNFGTLDSIIPMQGPKGERPSADGSQPPYFVTSPEEDVGVYVDTGSWEKVATPPLDDEGTVSGLAVDTADATTKSVTHGLPVTPSDVDLTLARPSQTDWDGWTYVDNVTDTGFDIGLVVTSASGTSGATVDVEWSAQV